MAIARPEQDVQRAVFQHIRQRKVPGVVAWHTPNGAAYGGKRNRKGIAIQGSIMAGLGVRAGVSDVIAVHKGAIFALELKADGGRPTEAQLEFLADMARAGAFTAIATGIDQALSTLEAWGLLRGSSDKFATPASKGATGRRSSTPTGPAVPPGAVRAVDVGEGTEAAQEFERVTG